MNAPVLDVLEARAGASDRDREAWLAERRTGVTATEIRDLYLRRITIRELVDRKLGRVPDVGDLSHVPVIGWGKLREPIIAAIVEQRFGIRPESRVFRASDNPRFLASPDGVGINFDELLQVCEIKTCGHDIPPWSDAYAQKGYEIQQQWVMRVLGAHRSLFAWEIREERGGVFTNGPLQFEWVQRNDRLIEELEALAYEFLGALDVAAAGEEPEAPVVEEVIDTHAVNYLRGLEAEKDGKTLKESAYRALVAAGVSQVSALAKVTYTPAKAGESGTVDEVDYAAAEAAAPELFAEMKRAAEAWAAHCEGFKRPVPVAGKSSPAKVTVTAVKPPQTKGEKD